MAADRQLSKNFRLSEFRGWEDASESQVATLHQLVTDVLQPARDEFGPIIPTSWLVWSSGEPRTGAHAAGGVDFVAVNAPSAWVHAWIGYSLPSTRWGELIDERDHVHVTPPGVGGNGEILVEWREGEYAPVAPNSPYLPDGTVWQLPGIVASVTGPRTWLAIVLGGALLLALARQRRE